MALGFFACVPFGCRLAVETCGRRYEEAQAVDERPREATAGPKPMLRRSACADCEVGKKHREGVRPKTWPDGTPIVRIARIDRGDGLTHGTFSKVEKTRRAEKAEALAVARAARRR